MREGISVTAIFQIVLLFILLFAGIMALTINNSNAFGVKDEIVNSIEQSNGNFYAYNSNDQLNDDLVQTMHDAAYRISGHCPEDYTGFNREGYRVGSSDKAAVCIKEVNVSTGIDNYLKEKYGDKVATGDFYLGKYYQVIVFFQLDLPVVNQIYNFQAKGETKIIYEEW